VDAALEIEVHQAIDAVEIDAAVVVERRGSDDVDALGVGRKIGGR
jgi:hypothetical protein